MDNNQQILSVRKNRTKKHFMLAFMTLIKEKGYHSVTVKDIVDMAAYNRSTFYIHYQDKETLAEDLLTSMLDGLEASVGKAYKPGRKVYTTYLNASHFNIISYIYKNRDFFELINIDDTLPGLHLGFPQTIQKIYKNHFIFETINDLPVNMDYFTNYTAFGFWGLLKDWIHSDFQVSQEEFIQEVVQLSKTHIYSIRYIGEE
ncbi:TetR/AcrR family transcriptional regulator [Oceanobacillus locisalsi]|uniref:TetR/AcrR family transcriptional regulator n=1 Tax=Oceanobacillus locisalsi TaxID=546107 RepID=A0ABW3NFW7_9BACI